MQFKIIPALQMELLQPSSNLISLHSISPFL